MNKQKGFTLIELMVSIAILGILGATALPMYQTWIGRARGSEAAIMVKQIIDAEIAYFLENEKFYPDDNQTYRIYNSGETEPIEVQNMIKKIEQNLKISIPIKHHLDYALVADNTIDPKRFTITITSAIEGTNIVNYVFGHDPAQLIGSVDETGAIDFFMPYNLGS